MLLACEVSRVSLLFYRTYPIGASEAESLVDTRFASQAWREEEAAVGTE